MKNITIEVPRTGTTVQFVLRAGASSGQAVIVTSDDVEIRLAEPPAPVPRPNSPPNAIKGKAATAKTPARDLDAIFKRLTKLKPTKRATAVNCIKSMFQFDAPINDEVANEILEALRKRGNLAIDAKGKLRIRNV